METGSVKRAKQTQAQKLDDALADAETFIDSTMGELVETMTHLRTAKRNIHMQRMTLKRLALPKLPKQVLVTGVQARWPSLLPKKSG